MQRAQVSLEYLITHSWMFLILVIVIFVLVSTGIFDVSQWETEDRIYGFASFMVTPGMYALTADNLTIVLGSKWGHMLNITSVNISNGCTGYSTQSVIARSGVLSEPLIVNISCQGGLGIGDRLTLDLSMAFDDITLGLANKLDSGRLILTIGGGFFEEIVPPAPPDTTPPAITFVPPTPGSGSSQSKTWVYVNVTTSENCLEARLEWGGVNTTMSGSNTSFYYNRTGLTQGTYSYKVHANDTSGNWNSTETRSITVTPASISFSLSSGYDVSDGSSATFTSTDITWLSTSDNSRMQSDGTWPTWRSSFHEGRYIEFIFSPSISATSIVNATITNEYRMTTTSGTKYAKLEIYEYGGDDWTDQTLTTAGTSDVTETFDVSSYINTVTDVNNLKVRFLAYSRWWHSFRTEHDYIGVKVFYYT